MENLNSVHNSWLLANDIWKKKKKRKRKDFDINLNHKKKERVWGRARRECYAFSSIFNGVQQI